MDVLYLTSRINLWFHLLFVARFQTHSVKISSKIEESKDDDTMCIECWNWHYCWYNGIIIGISSILFTLQIYQNNPGKLSLDKCYNWQKILFFIFLYQSFSTTFDVQTSHIFNMRQQFTMANNFPRTSSCSMFNSTIIWDPARNVILVFFCAIGSAITRKAINYMVLR